MLSLKGRQGKMEISEEFIKVYIIPCTAALIFSSKGCAFCTTAAESSATCLMPHVHHRKKWTHLPVLFKQSLSTLFSYWAVSGTLSTVSSRHRKPYTIPSCHLFWPLTSKSSCGSSLDAKCAGTACLNYMQMLHHHLPSWYFHLSWSERLNPVLTAYYGKGFLGHSWERVLLTSLFLCCWSCSRNSTDYHAGEGCSIWLFRNILRASFKAHSNAYWHQGLKHKSLQTQSILFKPGNAWRNIHSFSRVVFEHD